MGRGRSGLSIRAAIARGAESGRAKKAAREAEERRKQDKALQESYKQDISKLSDKKIDSMQRRTLEAWATKVMMAQAGEKFQPETVESARRQATALLPLQSVAQLRKTIKNGRKKFRYEQKYK